MTKKNGTEQAQENGNGTILETPQATGNALILETTTEYIQNAEKQAQAQIKRVFNTLNVAVVFNVKATITDKNSNALMYINKAELKPSQIKEELKTTSLIDADIITEYAGNHADKVTGFLIRQKQANLYKKIGKVMLWKEKAETSQK